ncbi:hypothetical protein JTE90_024616 [Oedothorax gibbosus]|uniref:Lipase domain-containing protein n=1 Tax=Oedothorax gibbosus TaxID=931172 RepID=A0AAV6UGB5_9ARAC|nr:hypothetical protein JTE90_024616 [Oedothorax gibbosus]
MASIAILCLLLMERFLASDMDSLTEPVLNGLRALERTALQYKRSILPGDMLRSRHKMARFYLFTPESPSGDGQRLDGDDPRGLRHFNPKLETKVIIHGFLDKVKIANWMHEMKDEFLMLDNFNVIVVDWSFGNFIPYTKAAANTEPVGEEIARLLISLIEQYGAKPEKFHLIGHSLGSHVAGYVGERVKGLKRISGLDPATYLFKNVHPKSKLDKRDAEFVDVIHTDGGGIGIKEPVGHVDFYPNGGEIQTGCTASNSLRALLEHGVVEGARNVICSHMRAPYLFTATIIPRPCAMLAYKCADWGDFSRGNCDSCGDECAVMGYHTDTRRDYGNLSKHYLLTEDAPPYCGYEYKITVNRVGARPDNVTSQKFRRQEWSTSDILQVSLYGSGGSADFHIEGENYDGWHRSHVVFSPSFLGDVLGAIIRWSKKPMSRAKGVVDLVASVVRVDPGRPPIASIHVSSLKTHTQWRIAPIVFELCVSPALSRSDNQQGATFRSEYC